MPFFILTDSKFYDITSTQVLFGFLTTFNQATEQSDWYNSI